MLTSSTGTSDEHKPHAVQTYFEDHSPSHQTSLLDSDQQACALLGTQVLDSPTPLLSEAALELPMVDPLRTQHHTQYKPFPFAFLGSSSAMQHKFKTELFYFTQKEIWD